VVASPVKVDGLELCLINGPRETDTLFCRELPEKIANDAENVKAWIPADPLMAKAGERIGGFTRHFFETGNNFFTWKRFLMYYSTVPNSIKREFCIDNSVRCADTIRSG